MAGAKAILHLFDESQIPVSGCDLCPTRAEIRHHFGSSPG